MRNWGSLDDEVPDSGSGSGMIFSLEGDVPSTSAVEERCPDEELEGEHRRDEDDGDADGQAGIEYLPGDRLDWARTELAGAAMQSPRFYVNADFIVVTLRGHAVVVAVLVDLV